MPVALPEEGAHVVGRCVPVARVQRRPKRSGEVPWAPSGERIQRNAEHSLDDRPFYSIYGAKQRSQAQKLLMKLYLFRNKAERQTYKFF